MRNKLVILFITALSVISITGCGGKGNTVSENLINNNPSDLSGDIASLLGSSDSQIQDESEFSSLYEGGYVEEEPVTPLDNDAFSVSEGSVSEGSIPEDGIINDSQEGIVTEGTGDAPAAASSSTYTEVENNKITFYNLSGYNIKALYLTTGTGLLTETDILNGKKLNDGSSFEFNVVDMNNLKNAGKLVFTVTAQVNSKTVIDFGQVEIIDVNHMNIVLCNNADGYYMYIE